MTASKSLTNQTAYLDFSQFSKLRQQSRQDSDAGMQATARQLEGVFLNMMLKSMRQANASFGEGNYLNGQHTEQFRDMYDQQLSTNLSSGRGIGLADMIVRQMKQLEGRKADGSEHSQETVVQRSFDISAYRERAVPTLLKPGISHLEQQEIAKAVARPTVEQQLFAPVAAEPVTRKNVATWQTPDEFVDAILPHAQRAARQLNVDPMAIVAQAVLETGWGKHVMKDVDGNHSFNLFGIKASAGWDGQTVNKKTLEYRNGIAAPEFAAFRSYASLGSAFDDYVKFLKNNPRYQNALQLNIEAKQWGYALQKAGYATDPNYGNKIASLLESDILQAKASATTTL